MLEATPCRVRPYRVVLMSWVLFCRLTLVWIASGVAFCALPLLFCLGMPEGIGFPLTRATIGTLVVTAAGVGLVVAAGHLLGVNLLRCPVCGSRAGFVLRKGDALLRCPRCGDVHLAGLFRPRVVVTVGPREDQPGDVSPRFRPVTAALLVAWLAWYVWLAVRNSS
jgi:hypothetical protein